MRLTIVNRFPRAQRSLLGHVILEDALQMVLLTVANRRTERSASLEEASGRLDALRITLRLSKRLGFLSNGGYASVSQVADEVGRMLGGWLLLVAAASLASSAAGNTGGVTVRPARAVHPPIFTRRLRRE